MYYMHVVFTFNMLTLRNQYELEVSVRKFQCKRDKKEKARVNYTMRTFMIYVICQILR